jgi:phosphopantothenoylcysteine decarboxylase/phosphopantothenate--cysteine ligase
VGRGASICASRPPRTSSPEWRPNGVPADAIERAREKLERKGVDAIVFNDVSRPEIGFDSADNEVTIVDRAGEHPVPLSSKDEVADAVLDRVEALRAPATTS